MTSILDIDVILPVIVALVAGFFIGRFERRIK